MEWVDIAILSVIGISTLFGLIRGFVKESLSLLSWVLATFIAITYSEELSYVFINHISEDYIRYAVAFLVLFILTLVVAALVRLVITQFVKRSDLSGLDRLLGMFFGVARGVFIIALVQMLISLTPVAQSPVVLASQILPYTAPAAVELAKFSAMTSELLPVADLAQPDNNGALGGLTEAMELKNLQESMQNGELSEAEAKQKLEALLKEVERAHVAQ